VLATTDLEAFADLSPDGRWLAYVSNESGPLKMLMKPYPGQERGVPVSQGGGTNPRWSHDGRRLFYWSDNKAILPVHFIRGELMVVDLEFQPSRVTVSSPIALFTANMPSFFSYSSYYDVSPVEDRFVVVEETKRPGATHFNVVLN